MFSFSSVQPTVMVIVSPEFMITVVHDAARMPDDARLDVVCDSIEMKGS